MNRAIKRLLAWLALALVGMGGYLALRARLMAIGADGRNYLAPGLVVAGVAMAAGLLCLRPAATDRSSLVHRRAAILELGLVLLGGLAFRAFFVGLPPAFSHDAYRYVWDAQLVAHGVSPWQHDVVDPALASLRDRTIWPQVNWRSAPTIYPPGAQALFLLVHLVAPLSIGAIQTAMSACDLVICGLLLVVLRQLGLDLRRVALYWWNPIPVLEFSFNAHVDAAATAFTLVALLAALRARTGRGRALVGIALGWAALIKIYPLLSVVALVRRRDWPLLGGMLATLVIVPLPFVRLGLGAGGFLATYFSQRFVDEGLAFRAITTLVAPARLQTIAQFTLLGLGCAAVLWARWANPSPTIGTAQGEEPAPPLLAEEGAGGEVRGMLAVTAAWLLLTPHLFPWYAGGALPLVALGLALGGVGQRALAGAIWLFTLAAPFTYVVFAPHVNPNLFLLFYLVPLAVALAPQLQRLARARLRWWDTPARGKQLIALTKGERMATSASHHPSRSPSVLPVLVPSAQPVSLPRELYIEVTNRCNELCDQCPRTHLKREPDRDLTLTEVRAIAEQLPALERVVLHGLGEPLLNPELPAIVAYLRGRDAHVLFNSNATALGERTGRALIAAGLSELRVSLDGARPETYARVRGVSAKTLPKILRNLGAFTRLQRELRADLPRVSFWFTAMRENLAELPGLVDLALATGVGEIYVQRLIYFGEGLAREEQVLYRRAGEEEQAIIAATEARCRGHGIRFSATGATTPVEYLSARGTPKPQRRPWSACRRPRTLAYISALGNVYSCCFAPFHPGPARERILGNVFETPFAEIWNGARYAAFRAAFDSDTPWDQCAGCGSKWSL